MTSGPSAVAGSRWLMRTPEGDEPVVICLPYAGMGASSYVAWPAEIGGARVVPVQPSGHENRMREECSPSPGAFARDFAPALEWLLPRPVLFAGHCGAVPYALETARLLRAAGHTTPMRLLASSWGAPHRDIYGPLNHRPLDRIDAVTDVIAMMRASGREIEPELAALYAEVLMDDLRAMRGYRFDPSGGLPVPVTVLAWSDDTVVPPAVCHDGWAELGTVDKRMLAGRHEEFLACPEPLRALVADEVDRMVYHG